VKLNVFTLSPGKCWVRVETLTGAGHM